MTKAIRGRSARPTVSLAVVPPVDLGLLPGQGLQAQISLLQGTRTVVQHQVAKMVLAARVAALAHHGVEAAGGERRVLLQGRPDKGQVRV